MEMQPRRTVECRSEGPWASTLAPAGDPSAGNYTASDTGAKPGRWLQATAVPDPRQRSGQNRLIRRLNRPRFPSRPTLPPSGRREGLPTAQRTAPPPPPNRANVPRSNAESRRPPAENSLGPITKGLTNNVTLPLSDYRSQAWLIPRRRNSVGGKPGHVPKEDTQFPEGP